MQNFNNLQNSVCDRNLNNFWLSTKFFVNFFFWKSVKTFYQKFIKIIKKFFYFFSRTIFLLVTMVGIKSVTLAWWHRNSEMVFLNRPPKMSTERAITGTWLPKLFKAYSRHVLIYSPSAWPYFVSFAILNCQKMGKCGTR